VNVRGRRRIVFAQRRRDELRFISLRRKGDGNIGCFGAWASGRFVVSRAPCRARSNLLHSIREVYLHLRSTLIIGFYPLVLFLVCLFHLGLDYFWDI